MIPVKSVFHATFHNLRPDIRGKAAVKYGSDQIQTT